MRAYDERLSVPATWWFLGGMSVAILGAEIWAGFGALAAIATYAVLAGVCGGTLLHWGSARIRVTDRALQAGGRELPRNAIGQVVPLDERQARAVRGERADPAAYMLIRPYLKRAVYVEVTGLAENAESLAEKTDNAASAPYWLVGTRRPEELAAALGGSPAHTGSNGPARRA